MCMQPNLLVNDIIFFPVELLILVWNSFIISIVMTGDLHNKKCHSTISPLLFVQVNNIPIEPFPKSLLLKY